MSVCAIGSLSSRTWSRGWRQTASHVRLRSAWLPRIREQASDFIAVQWWATTARRSSSSSLNRGTITLCWWRHSPTNYVLAINWRAVSYKRNQRSFSPHIASHSKLSPGEILTTSRPAKLPHWWPHRRVSRQKIGVSPFKAREYLAVRG